MSEADSLAARQVCIGVSGQAFVIQLSILLPHSRRDKRAWLFWLNKLVADVANTKNHAAVQGLRNALQ